MARVVLLSGMGADARMFANQLRAFPSAVCTPWIEPQQDERLPSYAKRLAAQIDDDRCVLVGASFGGFVAAEMTRHMRNRALVLIGSVRSPAELPPNIRALRRFAKLSAKLPFSALRPLGRLICLAPDSSLKQSTKDILRQASDADARFLRWACGAVLTWQENARPIPCPVYQIHGSADRILPARNTKPTHIIRGGGHVLSMTHTEQVNQLLGEVLRDCE